MRIYSGIEYPDAVFLQAILETGFFTSTIFLNGNNLFGMKLAKVRETTAIGEYNQHAQYLHWSDSVKDYALWQKWYKSRGYVLYGTDINEYLVFLRCVNYAEDPKYIVKLNTLNINLDVS
jgi:flagellum-specific peptidoglycan hydrolase FlgJ